MTIHAVFEHEDGYKFSQVYATKTQFLRSLRHGKRVEFCNAMDTDRAVVIYPSNLPEYIRMN